MAGCAASSTAPTNNARDVMQRAIKFRLCSAGDNSPDARSHRPVNTGNTALEGRLVMPLNLPFVPAKSGEIPRSLWIPACAGMNGGWVNPSHDHLKIIAFPESRPCNHQLPSDGGLRPASSLAAAVRLACRSYSGGAAFATGVACKFPASVACRRCDAANRAKMAARKRLRYSRCISPSAVRTRAPDQSCRRGCDNSGCRIRLRPRTRHTSRSRTGSRMSENSTR